MHITRYHKLGQQSRGQSSLIASFDPTILCTTYNYDMFPLGTRLEEIRSNFPQKLPIEQRLLYILKYSALYHERRHFHDIVGTTYGLKLFYYGQRILNQFIIECLPYLQKLKTIQVPFVRWVKRHDCPDEVHTFVETYQKLCLEVAWLTACEKIPESYANDRVANAYTPSGSRPIPVIRNEDKDPYSALGGFALEEGAAFAVENFWIREVFGEEYNELYIKQTMDLPDGQEYLTALSVFLESAQSNDLDLFLNACDYSLNIGFPGDFRAEHPGWRFTLLCEQLGWDDTSRHTEAMHEATKRIENNAEWPSLYQIWVDADKYCYQQIQHNKDFYSKTESLMGFVNLKYYSMAKAIFEKRIEKTIYYNPFSNYIQTLEQFPSPPLRRRRVEGNLIVTPSQNEIQNAWLWLSWCFLWQTVGNLLEGDGLHCLQRQGDSFSLDCFQRQNCGNTPGQSTCRYGEFLRQLGLSTLRCKAIG